MVACLAWQMVARDVRQMVAARFLSEEKTVFSRHIHSLLVMKRRVKLFERDGVRLRAGDGTRTRDSLLGRQAFTESPLD